MKLTKSDIIRLERILTNELILRDGTKERKEMLIRLIEKFRKELE